MNKMDNGLFNSNILEKNLDEILSPVDPKDNYVMSLRQRLAKKPVVTIEYPNFFYIIIIVCFGLFLGILLIWLIRHSTHTNNKD